jgi:hypothetical protein
MRFSYRKGAPLMLTLEDLIAFSGLSEEEILAIAEHENIPEAAACCLAEYLSQTAEGRTQIRDMIIDDIREAQARGDVKHVSNLLHVLHHYLRSYPGACPDSHPWSSIF